MDLSVVVPLYNEAENVEELYVRIRAELRKMAFSYEIIFVDDGSTDGTTEKLREIKKSEPALKVIVFQRNYGQTQAMVAGLQAARGRYIVTMDGDLQNDPADIVTLIVYLEAGCDMVSGWRKAREDNVVLRKIPSKIANAIISSISGVRIHDLGCSLKGFRRETAQNIVLYPEMHRFIPIFAASIGARIKEVQVTHRARLRGTSKYGIARTWKVMLDLIKVKILMDFSNRPSTFFSFVSIPFALAGVGLTGAFFYSYIWGHSAPDPSIVNIGSGMLYIYLAFSLMSFGYLAELLCVTRDYRQNKILGQIMSRKK